ncbi:MULTISPECIES: complex I subunit 4 family protein [unclassified Streptomyces]|uniref:complex I subunit 4 family protein n=1 Tax=unclassified Streptomyces TaxID=2593676 RepID=UPI0022B6AA83|nr:MULTISPECIES: NADH-quinone oxidoreductase subunit M [unclassified Streptomyces]MCZ7416547.1 NADH-quinone oxidoreductase subunit M [Streptomyces sp. WMMC897]MCZ7433642.1 NADH-quinone oxidoreductase subunit M [Streptomyces sp. WMMC1477]
MLSLTVFLPLAAAALLLAWRALPEAAVRAVWVAVSAIELALVAALWVTYDGPGPDHETDRPWMPSAGAGYHVGVDGLSLPLLALTTVVFLACAVHSLSGQRALRRFAALFLALETTCLGLFAALDLILFFLFFDLSIVGMYLVIAGWGHGSRAARSALVFFLYTFLGSLALLLGFIGLYAASDPHTFDIAELTAAPPLESGAAGTLVLAAIVVGLAVKTPVFPFHTWLPPAHTDAPAAGSAVLAAVLLKMGTYGFVRIAMPILPGPWRDWALVLVVAGVVSALYGALVALAQSGFKRMVAYTSVNHMGYILLALGAAGLLSGADEQARTTAVTGAVVLMVSHGLVTGALFLLSGVLWDRGGTYDMGAWGGLAGAMPRFAALTAVAAFASLGLPGFSGFVAEFQIFAGSLGPAPVATALALLGILVTAGLLLWALHRVFLGPRREPRPVDADLRPAELSAVAPLLGLSLLVGVLPRALLDTVEPAARTAVDLLAR